MKVVILKHNVVDGKLVFEAQTPVVEKSFDSLDENGEFSKDLHNLNIQRFMIRRSARVMHKEVMDLPRFKSQH